MGFSLQDMLIFSAEKLQVNFNYKLNANQEEIYLATPDRLRLNAIFTRVKDSKGVILYLHGNKGNLKSWKDEISILDKFSHDVIMFDYRGFGKSRGNLSEEGIYTDAESCYNYLVEKGYEPKKIFIYGRSLGTGPAIHLALNKPAAGLILEAPYISMLKMARLKYPFLFPSIFLSYKFDNLGKISKLKLPLLILHGKKDETIPYTHSIKLYNAATSEKELLILDDADHNSCSSFPDYYKALRKFLKLS